MNILILGGGGREAAIHKALLNTQKSHKYFCDKPNAQMALKAQALGSVTVENIESHIKANNIQLTIIGPEAPLVEGIANAARKAGSLAFGPGVEPAQLEASKTFSKNFMNEFAIPTAHAVEVGSVADIKSHLSEFTAPYVLKADGLCAGKGVFICKTDTDLFEAGKKVFEDKVFGDQKALLEQFQDGEELSYFFLTNGSEGISLPLFRDHKRLLENDEGPNTGGMGVIGPIENPELTSRLEDKVMRPTLEGFKKRGFDYRGVVFVGVMMTNDGPQVLEYNVRFGDPETQCIFPSLDTEQGDNWLTALEKIAKGELPKLNWKKDKVACVVAAAPGYPDKPEKNIPIEGDAFIEKENAYVIHAGTTQKEDQVLTSGGRVLSFIGKGNTYIEALDRAYSLTKDCHFKGMQIREDIGHSLI